MSGCPVCRYQFEDATVIDGQVGVVRPAPDDWSVCLNCGALLVFIVPPNDVRAPTPAEEASMADDARRTLDDAQAFIRARGAIPGKEWST